jgi:hypothetical protein
MLSGRLDRLVQVYRDEFGVDVSDIEGAGAAGGLAGALAALGGKLVPGFDLVADEIDLYDTLATADLVITGEGHMDAQSFEGKVVGGVQELCATLGTPVGAVVGDADDDVATRLPFVSLVQRYGLGSMAEPMCIEHAAADLIQALHPHWRGHRRRSPAGEPGLRRSWWWCRRRSAAPPTAPGTVVAGRPSGRASCSPCRIRSIHDRCTSGSTPPRPAWGRTSCTTDSEDHGQRLGDREGAGVMASQRSSPLPA